MASSNHYDKQAARNRAGYVAELSPAASSEDRYALALQRHHEKSARYEGPEPTERESLDTYLYGVCIVEAEAKRLAEIRAELDRRASMGVAS